MHAHHPCVWQEGFNTATPEPAGLVRTEWRALSPVSTKTPRSPASSGQSLPGHSRSGPLQPSEEPRTRCVGVGVGGCVRPHLFWTSVYLKLSV